MTSLLSTYTTSACFQYAKKKERANNDKAFLWHVNPQTVSTCCLQKSAVVEQSFPWRKTGRKRWIMGIK